MASAGKSSFAVSTPACPENKIGREIAGVRDLLGLDAQMWRSSYRAARNTLPFWNLSPAPGRVARGLRLDADVARSRTRSSEGSSHAPISARPRSERQRAIPRRCSRALRAPRAARFAFFASSCESDGTPSPPRMPLLHRRHHPFPQARRATRPARALSSHLSSS